MQFTIAALAAAFMAAGVSAAPAELESRQAGVVYVRFYGEADCQGNWIEDTVYFDDQTGACKVETLTSLPYVSWAVERNEAARTLSVYTRTDCTTQLGGSVLEVAAEETNCYSQRIGSVQFS